MLTLYLDPIFKARGIERPYTFLVKAGLSPHTASNILNAATRVFRLDHIELLCNVLVCEPNDLLMWTPDAGKKVDKNAPLANLIKTDKDLIDWKDSFASVPYKELKSITSSFFAKSPKD